MEPTAQRYLLSNNIALYSRKYLLGPLHFIIGVLLIWKASGFFFVFGFALAGIGLFYLLLRKIEFDEAFVYIGSRNYSYDQIVDISGFEINLYFFPLLKINDGVRKRWIFTDSGQAGLLGILLGIVFPSLDPLKNMKKFKEFWEASKF